MSHLVCHSTNYYISTTGNDGNNGTAVGTPKKTLGAIFTAYNLGSGDIINVAAGTYTETGIVVGADDEGFTIQGAALSGGVPTSIFQASSTDRWLLLGNTNNDNITINDISIINHKNTDGGTPGGGGGIKVIAGATGLSVNHCVFDNCDTRTASLQHRGGAIYSAEGITVTYCTFINCYAEYYGGCISIELSPANATTISHCYFYNNGATNYGGAIFFGAGATSTMTVTNCLFYKNNTTSGEGVIVSMNSYSTLVLINCTITANGNGSNGTGGVLSLSSAKINLKNCIIYNNVGTTYNDVYNNSSTVTMTNCVYGNASKINSITTNTSGKVANPLFTSAATDDYTLQSTSPCIDWGTLTGAPTDDIRHYSRVNNPDAGCFETNGVNLPIELIDFRAICYDNSISIYWVTASEINNDYFLVERSKDLINWESVDMIMSAGNSNVILSYTLTDNNEYDYIYYRLKQVDFDGKYSYSNSIYVSCNSNSLNIVVRPNPVKDNLYIDIWSPSDMSINVVLYNMIGQQLYSKIYHLNKNTNTIDLNNLNLPTGAYHLLITHDLEKLFNDKIIFE